MREFISTDKYGKLCIDRILFESYFPIIFTCKNEFDEIFICVCCQNNDKGCKWLVGKTDGTSVIQMLKDEITIREMLCEYSSGKISIDYVNGEYRVEYNNSDWDEDSIYLPKNDSYMFAEEGEFDDDIAYFSTLVKIRYDANYYKSISGVLDAISKDTEFMTDKFNEFISWIGDLSVSGDVMSTVEVNGKLPADMDKGNNIDQVRYMMILDNRFGPSLNDEISIKIGAVDNSLTDAA